MITPHGGGAHVLCELRVSPVKQAARELAFAFPPFFKRAAKQGRNQVVMCRQFDFVSVTRGVKNGMSFARCTRYDIRFPPWRPLGQ